METSAPPSKLLNPWMAGGIGAVLVLLPALLVYGLGWVVPAGELERARQRTVAVEGELGRERAEVERLRGEQQAAEQQRQAATAELEKLKQTLEAKQSLVQEFIDKEQAGEITASLQEMNLADLALRIHAIEGIRVKVLPNGLLVTGIAEPFRLGSTRLEDDGLVQKLREVAAVFNEHMNKTGREFYAGAVGHTDAMPVLPEGVHGSNLWLGAQRARGLAGLMQEAGFPDDRVFLISWGSIHAAAEGEDAESRRPELFLVSREVFEESLRPVAQ